VHILTKILVVFAAVLSLALAALTSTYALNADKIASAYQDKDGEAKAVNAKLELQSSQFAQERIDLETRLRNKDEQIAQLDGQRRTLESQLAERSIAAKQAQDSAARIERQIGDLGKTTETQASLIDSLTGEVRTLRDENLAAKNQQIDLLARLSDLETQNDVLTQTNRALQVTIADLQSQLDGGPAIAQTSGAAAAPQPVSGPLVRGTVQAVRRVNDQFLAEINLGERDRIRDNAKLFITRDGEWLADLVIIKADIQNAVGRVDTLGRAGIEIRKGDTVLSSLGG
jgi:archaellum component FlaC